MRLSRTKMPVSPKKQSSLCGVKAAATLEQPRPLSGVSQRMLLPPSVSLVFVIPFPFQAMGLYVCASGAGLATLLWVDTDPAGRAFRDPQIRPASTDCKAGRRSIRAACVDAARGPVNGGVDLLAPRLAPALDLRASTKPRSARERPDTVRIEVAGQWRCWEIWSAVRAVRVQRPRSVRGASPGIRAPLPVCPTLRRV